MVLMFTKGADEPVFRAQDSSGSALTDTCRLQRLFQEGFQFEAVAAQAVLIEAGLLSYMGTRRQADGLQLGDRWAEQVRNRTLTLGRMAAILREVSADVDGQLVELLDQYVKLRNDLAHNLLVYFHRVDLELMYGVGNKIVRHIHSRLEKIPG